MSEKVSKPNKEGGIEKSSRWLRNFNALGAIAIGGVGLAVNSGILIAWGAINAAQAVFFEGTRRWAKNRKSTKKMGGLALKPA